MLGQRTPATVLGKGNTTSSAPPGLQPVMVSWL